MAKKIIWSNQAQNDRKQILQFWIEHNKSKTYSRKLNQLFLKAVKLIARYPKIGRLTEIEKVRGKIVRDYFIFYQINGDEIQILSIWGSKQNPNSKEDSIQQGSS